MQDPGEAASVTHVVVGEGGIAALPPQLQPGGAHPATSSSGLRSLPAVPASGGGAGKGLGQSSSAAAIPEASGKVYVSHHWVECSLAKGRLLPLGDFPPPDPAAEVPTPTAGSGEWAACLP